MPYTGMSPAEYKRVWRLRTPPKFDRTCSECARPFATNRTQKLTCSVDCSRQREFRLQSQKLRKKNRQTAHHKTLKICPSCHTDFAARDRRQVTCAAPECKQALRNQRWMVRYHDAGKYRRPYDKVRALKSYYRTRPKCATPWCMSTTAKYGCRCMKCVTFVQWLLSCNRRPKRNTITDVLTSMTVEDFNQWQTVTTQRKATNLRKRLLKTLQSQTSGKVQGPLE